MKFVRLLRALNDRVVRRENQRVANAFKRSVERGQNVVRVVRVAINLSLVLTEPKLIQRVRHVKLA